MRAGGLRRTMKKQPNPDPVQPQPPSYQDRVAEELDLFRELTTLDPRCLFFTTPGATKRALDAVPVSDAVPDNVRTLVRRVSSLLVHAYLDYEYNDVASELALLYLESVLRMRLDRPFKQRERVNLRGLAQEAREKGLLPARYTDSILEATFTLRNHSAHAGGQQLIGPFLAMTSYHRFVDMINCLYDEGCRKHEPEVFVQWRKQMEGLNAELVRLDREREETR